MKGFAILFASLLAASTSLAFGAEPDFKDYSVTPVFTGTHHELVPQENSSPTMGSARAKALQGKVNFAGHYILHRLGCGGSAICGEVLNVRTLSSGCRMHTTAAFSICPTSPIAA